jgi:hypothetical protein
MGAKLGVNSDQVRDFTIEICQYAQHPKAIAISLHYPKKRRGWLRFITPMDNDAVPMFCMAVRGYQQMTFQPCSISLFALCERPEEWPVVRQYYAEASERIAGHFDVLFDWRNHFGAGLEEREARIERTHNGSQLALWRD